MKLTSLIILVGLTTSLLHGIAPVPTMPTDVSPEVTIKVSNKSSDDSNIVLNVQVSGSNEKDIAKIVDLITNLLQKLDTSGVQAQQSWVSRNGTVFITAVSCIGLTAAAAALYMYLKA